MRFRIGCVDGNTYSSDEMSRAEIQAEIDRVYGYIGTGDLANKKFHTADEFIEFVVDSCKYNSRNDTQVFRMTISGNQRQFNVCHIVWCEVVD